MATVRDAYLAHEDRRTVNPSSIFLRFPDRPSARIIALPSHLGHPWQVSGLKWIASYPENTRHGFPRASAVLVLNSNDNGYPFACLEASVISAARTAASAVLAANHLGNRDRQARSLGIVGTGLIARYVYQFLVGTKWEIENVRLYDLARVEAERFGARVCEGRRHKSVEIAPDLQSLLKSCDLILFATVAPQPYIFDSSLFDHRPLVLHLSLRDLAPQVLLQATNVVDDIDHVMQAETSPHLAEKLTGSRSFVSGTLAQVITGACTVSRSRPIIFSPFGLGVLDLAVGKWVYDRAIANHEHVVVDDFFHDLER